MTRGAGRRCWRGATASPGRSVVIAHLGQSLDGRIATVSGLSRWVTGAADLLHTHRMRALADAVIVGAGTVEHDDPQLTVRRCTGRHPVRVVIDPDGRLAPTHRIFDDVEAPTLVVTADDGVARDRVDTVRLPREGAVLSPPAMVAALAARGLHRLFIEGGGVTVSRFLAARCLDRLQLTVAPLLLGSGRPSLALPEILDPADGLRPRVRRVALDEDTLFECIFRE